MKNVIKRVLLETRLNLLQGQFNGLHDSLRHTLLCGRVLGLMPLSGLTKPTSEKLRFSLKGPYVVLYLISLGGQFFMFALSLFWFLGSQISLTTVTNFVFYSTGFTSLLIVTNIAKFWPTFTATVEQTERRLPPFTRNVAQYCNATTCVVFALALIEHTLSVLYGIVVARACTSNDIGQMYFQNNMPWIFDYVPYSFWKGMLFEVFNIQTTFMWSFNDLIVVVISIYLSEHFILHARLLKKAMAKENYSCDEFRIQYLDIVRIVRLVNNKIGVYILLSFTCNLYWICTQLFYSLKNSNVVNVSELNRSFSSRQSNTGHIVACHISNQSKFQSNGLEHFIYFAFSFSFIVARTLLVLLMAARVHTSAKKPLMVLYSVPTNAYSTEVERFIDQINNMKVGISGCGFFYVTRTMILSLLTTIITYELVLIQFNK